MEPAPNRVPAKELQKYLQIKPNIKQLYFSDHENVDSIFQNKMNKKIKNTK